MYTTQKLCIELTSQDNENTHRVYTVQGDYCTRKLELTLYCGGEPWRLPEGATVAVRYQKPDGTQGIYDTLPDGTKAWDAQENTVTVMLAPQMLTVPGCVIAQVEMVLGSLVLSTFSIHVIVKDDPSDGVTESEDYVNWQQWMNEQLDQHLSQAAADGLFIPAFSIGTVSTLPPGASATADITGSVDRPILNLGIPASGTGCIADPTLSLSGYSADAKATGNAISQLASEISNRKWHLIWQNTNHLSMFLPQTLSYDLSAYTHFKIEMCPVAIPGSNYPLNTVEGIINTPILGFAHDKLNENGGFGWVSNRIIEISSTGITFQSGSYVVIADGTSAFHNDYCIPVRVWAMRG